MKAKDTPLLNHAINQNPFKLEEPGFDILHHIFVMYVGFAQKVIVGPPVIHNVVWEQKQF